MMTIKVGRKKVVNYVDSKRYGAVVEIISENPERLGQLVPLVVPYEELSFVFDDE